MIRRLALVWVLLSLPAQAADDFAAVAEAEIRALVNAELFGHYDIESISILTTRDRVADHGLKTVVAEFAAVRNAAWSKNLNRWLIDHCDKAGSVYVLCQPAGHRFAGKLEVDMAYATSGWKILDRHYRSRREFVLSKYLLLEGRPKEGYVLPPRVR